MKKGKSKGQKRTAYLSTEELMDRWDAKLVEIFRLVNNRLIAPVDSGFPSHVILSDYDLNGCYFDLAAIERFERSNPDYAPTTAPCAGNNAETPPYLDKKDKMCRKTFDVGLMLLNELYGPNGVLKPHKPHARQIRSHIEKKHPEITDVDFYVKLVSVGSLKEQKI